MILYNNSIVVALITIIAISACNKGDKNSGLSDGQNGGGPSEDPSKKPHDLAGKKVEPARPGATNIFKPIKNRYSDIIWDKPSFKDILKNSKPGTTAANTNKAEAVKSMDELNEKLVFGMVSMEEYNEPVSDTPKLQDVFTATFDFLRKIEANTLNTKELEAVEEKVTDILLVSTRIEVENSNNEKAEKPNSNEFEDLSQASVGTTKLEKTLAKSAMSIKDFMNHRRKAFDGDGDGKVSQQQQPKGQNAAAGQAPEPVAKTPAEKIAEVKSQLEELGTGQLHWSLANKRSRLKAYLAELEGRVEEQKRIEEQLANVEKAEQERIAHARAKAAEISERLVTNAQNKSGNLLAEIKAGKKLKTVEIQEDEYVTIQTTRNNLVNAMKAKTKSVQDAYDALNPSGADDSEWED